MDNTYTGLIAEALEQIPAGAFLTTGSDHNPMTIGWCQFGAVWGRPVCTVLVRQTRHTHALIERAETFTVSVPRPGDMHDALALCGTKSGRDLDKCEAAGLTVLPARAGGADGIADCACYFECRILFKTESDLSNMDPIVRRTYYGSNQATPDGDPHTVYFGEILSAYRG